MDGDGGKGCDGENKEKDEGMMVEEDMRTDFCRNDGESRHGEINGRDGREMVV